MAKSSPKVKLTNAYDKIADGVIYGNLGIFVGAGLPMAIMNDGGESIAFSWPQLLEKCAKFFDLSFKSFHKPGKSYPEIASQLCKKIASKKNITQERAGLELKQVIADLTSLYPNSKARAKFKEYFDALSPGWIITTNYDTIIESVLTGTGHSLAPEDQLIAPIGRIPVFHLHGIRTNPTSIVITQEDYVALFRPNEYRLQKLPLTIKESVTLLIGYGLGDFNVLTALDWSRNVLGGKDPVYPNEMIQLVRAKRPKVDPYYRDGILIIEFKELDDCLSEICDYVIGRKTDAHKAFKKLKKIGQKYSAPTPKMITDFIGDKKIREKVLTHLSESKHSYINGFLELLSRALEQVWKKARQPQQFPEYDRYLNIILDIFDSIEVNSMPPALMQTISFGLDKVAFYVGPGKGDARAAYRTWLKRGPKLKPETLKELVNISKLNPNYFHLGQLLQKLDTAHG